MKTFTVTYGADVSCYGTFEIEARDEAHALEVAREAFDLHTHELEPEWENGFEQERIVNIEDEEGETFHEGAEIYPITSVDANPQGIGDALLKLVYMLEGTSGAGAMYWAEYPEYANAVRALRDANVVTKDWAESRLDVATLVGDDEDDDA